MVIWALLALAAFAALVWAGRRPREASAAVRLGSGLASGLAAIGAVVAGLRGGWPVSVVLMLASIYFAERARLRASGPGARAGRAGQGPFATSGQGPMSRRDACAILGVAEDASRDQIDAAWRRLMARAHPDQGGTAGLAAQLNAARDTLVKG